MEFSNIVMIEKGPNRILLSKVLDQKTFEEYFQMKTFLIFVCKSFLGSVTMNIFISKYTFLVSYSLFKSVYVKNIFW